MALSMHMLRFVGGWMALLGGIGVLAGAPLGPFYFLAGVSLWAGGWPAE